MKVKLKFNCWFLLGAFFLLVNSCKKQEELLKEKAQFTANKTIVVVDEEIQFTNTSANASAFKWSFGDGTISTAAAPTKAYFNSSVYQVSLVSTGEGGSTISNMLITVVPFCSFNVDHEDSLFAGVSVQFVNQSKGANQYEWTFGDGNNSTSADTNATFVYETGGTYTVTLKAVGEGGESVFSKQITLGGVQIVKQLYFIEYDNNLIGKLPLDGSGNTTTVADIAGKAGVGLAYDNLNGKIYFSDFEVAGSGNIWRMDLDGSNLEVIASSLTDPYGIALDITNNKIYWTDDLGNISRSNLDGTMLQIGIVNITNGQMRAIALDEENNKMYFYEVNNEDLYVANLDGSNPTVLFSGVYGYAIAIDKVNNNIYFDDQNTSTLVKTTLDGLGGFTTIDSDGSKIYGILVDNNEGKIYWSGRDSGKLSRANLDGSGSEVLIDGLASPRGIFLKQ